MFSRLAGLAAALAFAGIAAAAPLNLTGTWQPKYWTVKIALQQDGDRIWGADTSKGFWFRGQWDGKRYIIVTNNFEEKRRGACKPRGVFTLTGSNVSNLATVWRTETGKQHKGPWTRLSPDGGPKLDYPYATELAYCGSLRAYELVFASASDKLQGSDWPILAALAGVLKQDPKVKIQVAGHTDSVGDAKKNQQLSERRAAAVKQVLGTKYGADAARIDTKGWGAEQPVEDNNTEDGRALNRRVEIVLAR